MGWSIVAGLANIDNSAIHPSYCSIRAGNGVGKRHLSVTDITGDVMRPGEMDLQALYTIYAPGPPSSITFPGDASPRGNRIPAPGKPRVCAWHVKKRFYWDSGIPP